MEKIEFLPLKKHTALIKNELIENFTNVVDSGIFLNGKQNSLLKTNLSNLIQVPYVVNCSNGFDSLKLIFSSLIVLNKLKEGDEILVPAFTFIASITSIIKAGLKPILIDIDSTFNIDSSLIEAQITPKTKGILLVHLFGQSSWNSEIELIIKRNRLLAIEDCAQSIGAEYNGLKLGSLGIASAFSFYPGKNIGALGDAGAVCTNDFELYKTVSILSNYGSGEKYHHDLLGENCRMDEIQAGAINIKISKIQFVLDQRRKIANQYLTKIVNPKIKLPLLINNSDFNYHAWHLFVIRVKNRKGLINYLNENNIESIIHYPIPYHHQKFVNSYHKLPITEKISDECLSIPNHEFLTQNQSEYIIEVLNKF
jgi:dTDP-4-amino-4,6-dideoxygalactose transaminase